METVNFRWLATEIDTRNSTEIDYPLMSVSQTKGVIPRADLMGNQGRAESLENYKVCLPGQIVINRMSASSGALGLATQGGLISPDYAVLAPTPLIDPKYLEYLMRSKWFVGEMVARLKGIGVGGESASVRTPRINISDLRDVIVKLPHIYEQKRIIDFLHRELGKVDELILMKKESIALNLEGFNSFRHELVTGRELLPKIETDIGWLDSVPKIWKKMPLRAMVSFTKGKDPARLNLEYCSTHPGEFPVYSGQTENSGLFAKIDTFDFNLPGGALLIRTVGTLNLVGTTTLISGKVSLSQNCALLLPKSDQIDLLYLHYVLPSLLEIKKAGIPSDMQASLRFADLSKFWLHWPEVEVQSQIANEISASEKYVMSMNDLIKSSIDLLEEYKTSLITQAVTGNLDFSSGKGTT